ncbi:hypothetical protein H4S08_000313 [Coemansia sp. RSA 1365]|nr:hypothetical protein H4S08_000313 [Coemansia sp. RSA 1365]
MFRPKIPFFRKAEHRSRITSEYRRLLVQAEKFSDPVERTYLRSWIRERFHYNKQQTSPTQVEMQLGDAIWASLVMDDALAGVKSQKQYINDLAYGRTGLLKDVVQSIREFYHPTKICQLIRDVRPRSSRIHLPNRAYWIPLDLRAFDVPQHLLDRIKRYDEKMQSREAETRKKLEGRIAKEIAVMTREVNRGNKYLWDAGLLPGAFSSVPEVANSPDHIPGIAGNPAWIPPKIKYRLDPPFVQHLQTSIGFEYFSVNARRPPHWLAAKIAAAYRTVSRRLLQHEFYFYFIEDLRLEEEFEARLGINDPGYHIYASNYREYLRGKIKRNLLLRAEATLEDSQLKDLIEDGSEEYNRMEEYAMEQVYGDEPGV